MNGLDGANCADVPSFVIDKYFNCNAGREPDKAQVAKAICSHCVVSETCREQALNMPMLPAHGVIGGVAVYEMTQARQWCAYELGLSDRTPRGKRPEWLPRSEAAEITEQGWLENDPDEPPVER